MHATVVVNCVNFFWPNLFVLHDFKTTSEMLPATSTMSYNTDPLLPYRTDDVEQVTGSVKSSTPCAIGKHIDVVLTVSEESISGNCQRDLSNAVSGVKHETLLSKYAQ